MKELLSLEVKEAYIKEFHLGEVFDQSIGSICRLFEYEKGEDLIWDGMELTYLLFLVKGEIKIYTALENGKSHLLRIESPLNVYGDIEVMDNKLCSAYVTTLNKCHIIGVPARIVRSEYANHPPFLKYLIDSLRNRLLKISYKSTEDSLVPLKNKLASFIVAHLDVESDSVIFKSTWTGVAEQLGSTYRHLSRVIKELIEEGYIEKEGKKIKVLNKSGLRILGGDTYKY